ncbi:hypothetical protein OHB26_01515 [Nocardia sp. NBC_01503]|uniref:hypothetical protein n=1 Tax=Nocardia sp. NBC_01503 TaxID=2975997 RepID=UPI002E7AE763|nr:hypothetical protein [Nocardia sp. NBC_01503]WTL32963.1 hypothetical protein OHB26_01515 [Nocardia sp. NBC_01503]
MPWDAWVLIALFATGLVIVVAALIEDIKNTGKYDDSPPRPVSVRVRGGTKLELHAASVTGRHRRQP